MERSHKKRRLQEQASRNLWFVGGGIVILFVIIFAFGTDILINFALLMSKLTGSDTVTHSQEDSNYVAPPVLNDMNDATSSAKVIISGTGEKSQTIKLYVNGKLADKTSVKSDQSFTLRDVTLDKGENEIKAKAFTDNNKESTYSNSITVTYLDKAPNLEVSSPSDGQTFSKSDSPIKISGKADSGAKVTVNDFWAITLDDGSFSYQYPLQDGDNHLKVVAEDEAGNKTTKELTIKVQ